MRYNKEVTDARKVYDSLVIEQREAKKQLDAVKAEIRAKLEGKPTPRKLEDLKKLEAQEQKYSAELDKALDEYAELKAAYFTPALEDMVNDLYLGLSVVALGLIVWLVVLFIKDPKGVVKASFLKKK